MITPVVLPEREYMPRAFVVVEQPGTPTSLTLAPEIAAVVTESFTVPVRLMVAAGEDATITSDAATKQNVFFIILLL